MSSLSDLDSTLNEAVRSYRIVKKMRTLKPASDVNRTVENLAQDHLDNPEWFGLWKIKSYL